MNIKINELDADLFLALYISVGMVRVIGDGGMSFYIKDFAVIPEYQSKGV